MDSINILSPGEHIDVLVQGSKYHCSVLAMPELDELLITPPVSGGKVVQLPEDDLVGIVYNRATGSYSFMAMKTGEENGGVRLTIKSPISKYQRRDFVRFDTMMPVKVRVLEEGEEGLGLSRYAQMYENPTPGKPRPMEEGERVEECVIIDLSGGGARFDANGEYKPGSVVECTMALRRGEEVTVDAIVIQSDKLNNGLHRIRTQFVSLDEHIRRKVIKFIFDEQIRMGTSGI